nr:S8 family serine peptidase [Modestobacter versicolor]
MGVTVAVLDTGVDPTHPQLAGRVLPGADVVGGTGSGDYDCVGHGTALASIVVAGRVPGIGFTGLAPDARVLPVRVATQAQTAVAGDVDPAAVAAGLDAAVAAGAQVALVGVVTAADPGLAAAVERAQAAGVLVVAPAGDAHAPQRDGAGPTDPALIPFPAAYPGVLGVAAVDSGGQRVDGSQAGGYVDLAGPGGDVLAAGIGGQTVAQGTGPAAAFVAAAAALVLSAAPAALTAATPADRAVELAGRLTATASAGGSSRLVLGAGLLDPARAVTEPVPGGVPSPVAGPTPPPADPAAEALAARQAGTRATATAVAATLGGLVVAVLAAAWALPRMRRRGWRAGRERAAQTRGAEEPGEFLPGEALFTPGPPHR